MKQTVITLLSLSILTFAGCTSVEQPATNIEENNNYELSSDSRTENAVSVEETDAIESPTEWGQAYLEYLDKLADDPYDDPLDYSYSLAYIDDDDIPELWIDTNVEAGGELIVTYNNGETTEQQLSRIGSSYIPKSGLIYTDTGHMDYYPVYITKLENGIFSNLASGIYYMSEEALNIIRETEYYDESLYTYEWEDREVTEDEFDRNISNYIDRSQLVRPDQEYQYEEIISILNNGKWLSYNHRYELITDDVTWQEAFDEAKESGGYLAIITCNEENSAIQSLIEESYCEDISYYVAYRDSEWVGNEFYMPRWVQPDGSFLQAQLIYPFDGQYKYSSEWNIDNEDCGLMQYSSSDNILYMQHAPEDVISVSPEYAGKIGYIIEYDN